MRYLNGTSDPGITYDGCAESAEDAEFGRKAANAQILYGDNQDAIALANITGHHARTKHIDIKYHFIHEYVENGVIQLEYCPTEDTVVADGLTKTPAKERR
jgi:hypothetical protein